MLQAAHGQNRDYIVLCSTLVSMAPSKQPTADRLEKPSLGLHHHLHTSAQSHHMDLPASVARRLVAQPATRPSPAAGFLCFPIHTQSACCRPSGQWSLWRAGHP